MQRLTLGLCRVGHHSTSDDSFAYRARQEVEDRKKVDNPVSRLRLFLESRKWWSDDEETDLKARQKKDILTAFKRAENLSRWELKELFSDVYAGDEPWNLVSFLTRVSIHQIYLLMQTISANNEKNSVNC